MGNTTNPSEGSSVPPPAPPGDGSLPLTGGPELILVAIGAAALLAAGALLRRQRQTEGDPK
jgi:LPXTG-motif cell wall-anchored protein